MRSLSYFKSFTSSRIAPMRTMKPPQLAPKIMRIIERIKSMIQFFSKANGNFMTPEVANVIKAKMITMIPNTMSISAPRKEPR